MAIALMVGYCTEMMNSVLERRKIVYIELGFKYWKYHRRRALFLVCSILLSVAALISAALLVRSNKLQQLEGNLAACGDYDFEFYNVSEAAEKELRADKRFAQFGTVYWCGYAKAAAGTDFEVGCVEDKTAEEMLHLTPLKGRYPQKDKEICIDKFTLNAMGCPSKTGQEITLTCMDWEKKELKPVKFTVVGLIEQTVISEYGNQYIQRGYNKEYESGKTEIVNCPFAYITKEAAGKIYGTDFQKILFANVSVTDTFDDQDMKEALLDKYQKNGEWTGEFLYDFNKVAHRSWMAQTMLGDGFYEEEDIWGYNAAKKRIGTDNVQPDFYSAVLIPVFFILIVLVTFCSLYNAISMTFSDRIRQNGMLRCLGMGRFRCQRHLALEAGMLLVPGILFGYGFGFLIYAIVQQVQKHFFGIYVISAGDVSDYFRPYLEEVTVNPVTFPFLAICVALIPAVVFPAIKSGRVSPVAACAVRERLHKKQRRFQVLLYINLFVVMAAAVFGYCYFCADNDDKNTEYQTQLTSTGVAKWDYYMNQNKLFTAKGWGDELRHDTGISKEDLNSIRENPAVEQSEATIINLSTKVAVKDTAENMETMDTLEGTIITEFQFPIDEEEQEIYDLRVEREMKNRGYKKNELVYEVPSIGIEDSAWKNLEQYVTEGTIHLDKIKAGTEVVLVVTDTQSCTYHAGDSLPLNDDVYPEILDENEVYRSGGMVDFVKPTYEADGKNWAQYCYARRKKLDVTIGAIMVINDEMDFKKYFFDEHGTFPWNIFVSDETFQSWDLPDNRYSRLWVKCKEGVDTEEFGRLWYQVLFNSKLMLNYVAQDIQDRIEATNREGMTLFFAMLFMITVISILGTANAFGMGIRLERKRFGLLRAIGMKKSWLLKRKWAENAILILFGGALSLIPLYAFNRLVQYTEKLIEEAWQNGAGKPLPDGHWAWDVPRYHLMEYHPIAAVFAAILITLLFSSFVFLLCMKRELDDSISDSIRENE